MLITEIKNLDKKKKLIYIDYEPEFALYNSEVRKFQLEQNDEIEPDVLEEIYKLLITRCKTRVSYILAKSDKTSHDLIQSLRKSYYPELIVRKVVDEYVEKGYVNDMEYARCYIRSHMQNKSMGRITSLLMNKGISKEVITQAVSEIEEELDENTMADRQKEMIRREIEKKKLDVRNLDRKLLNKVIASFLRKGFSYDDIYDVIGHIKENELFDDFCLYFL